MELPNFALVNYLFPNNTHVWWGLPIVIYPFITGLIAGAFVVSSLYHVLKIEVFKPIANFALVAAFCFGLFAAVPLLFHLGQPQRFYEIYVTPHTTSAMSIMGYVYSTYMVLLTIELWLIYRPFFIKRSNETTGLMGLVWAVLTLGVRTYNPQSARIDHKVITFLAGIGIPWAFLLHGYVGFVFGSVKAIPWWATALQPLIFLSSAIVSGMAVLLLMYGFIKWRTKTPYDFVMARKFAIILWAVFFVDYALEILELVHVSYQRGHEWADIGPLLSGPLFNSYVIAQMGIFSITPAILHGWVALTKVRGRAMVWLINIGCVFLVAQVLTMRFNVVIGGQLISKSGRGFLEFDWEILSSEGVVAAAVILAAPFVTYYVISRFIPVFDDPSA